MNRLVIIISVGVHLMYLMLIGTKVNRESRDKELFQNKLLIINCLFSIQLFVLISEYLMSLAAAHDPSHHAQKVSNSHLLDFNRNTSNSTEFDNTKIPSRMDFHINNGSLSSHEEPYQADEAVRPETGFPVNETGHTETFHDFKPAVMEASVEKRPDAAAATSAASSVSYPIILHTLLDDEDMFVGSGDQASAQMDEQEVELRPFVEEQEDWEPETENQADDNDDDDEEYEVIENTSDILGYFKGKILREEHNDFVTSFAKPSFTFMSSL